MTALTGEYSGVIDRIVDGETAVVLLEACDKEVLLSLERLPEHAQENGAVLSLVLEEGTVTDVTYSEAETATRRETLQDRFESLSRRLSEE